jgi:hypothetical protein
VTKAVAVLPLLLVVPACPVVAGPPEAPRRDFGKAKVEMPVPSTWVVIRGWKGDTSVTKGSVTFKDGNEVEIWWKVEWDTGSCNTATSYNYQRHPKSGLPVIGSLVPRQLPDFEELGTFRMVGACLEFRLVGSPPNFMEPPGDLFLLLKPGDK